MPREPDLSKDDLLALREYCETDRQRQIIDALITCGTKPEAAAFAFARSDHSFLAFDVDL